MVQSCQVCWEITIPGEILALQLNLIPGLSTALNSKARARARVNFNGLDDPQAEWVRTMAVGAEDNEMPINPNEHVKFWLGYSTAYGPFQQIAICKDNTKLWQTSIYSREQAVIAVNSLSDSCTKNSVSVSPLETVVSGRRHCGVSIDIPVEAFAAGSFNYLIQYPITIAGELDLNQLNPKFNSFPVLTRNYASLYLQLWTQDFLQDLKVVWLNKSNTITNQHLAYQMIPSERPDLIFLLNTDKDSYSRFPAKIVNIKGKAPDERRPKIQQVKLRMQDSLSQKLIINFQFRGFSENGGSMQSMMSYSNIKAMFITFALNQYPTWFFPVLFQRFNLEIDQRHIIQQEYVSLNPMVTGQMFECFVEQDLVSAPLVLYHSLNFQNQTINESNGNYYGYMGTSYIDRENIFYYTTLYIGSKVVKIYYLYKFMLAWKMATDDSFMRGYNSTKMGARTNIQVTLQGSITQGIIDNSQILDAVPGIQDDQNNLLQFIATRAYPTPTNAQITPQMHYLCDAIIRFTFDDAPDPQVLNFEIIGEVGGTMLRSG
ncbi:MAG: hypothetical protein EZS28_009580 [Streblomastix strix]|uniref:Uncharacterized protein n=1 Tax=Streblomastix strix TaxID=222440 RepID=A0A5J4WJG9_9EUKA|nr:MAG: hypothetical protein EZS28_009580 [Streblomastix strix]